MHPRRSQTAVSARSTESSFCARRDLASFRLFAPVLCAGSKDLSGLRQPYRISLLPWKSSATIVSRIALSHCQLIASRRIFANCLASSVQSRNSPVEVKRVILLHAYRCECATADTINATCTMHVYCMHAFMCKSAFLQRSLARMFESINHTRALRHADTSSLV